MMLEKAQSAHNDGLNVNALADLSFTMLPPIEPSLIEKRVVLAVWDKLQLLLLSGLCFVQQTLGLMLDSMPSFEELPQNELTDLARLHMSSATNLRRTMHVLVPDAFPASSSWLLPDSGTVNELDDAQADAVAVLIELQLFHLHRASALLEHHRKAQAPAQQEACKPPTP